MEATVSKSLRVAVADAQGAVKGRGTPVDRPVRHWLLSCATLRLSLRSHDFELGSYRSHAGHARRACSFTGWTFGMGQL